MGARRSCGQLYYSITPTLSVLYWYIMSPGTGKDTHAEDLATVNKAIVEDTLTAEELPLGQGGGEEGIAD